MVWAGTTTTPERLGLIPGEGGGSLQQRACSSETSVSHFLSLVPELLLLLLLLLLCPVPTRAATRNPSTDRERTECRTWSRPTPGPYCSRTLLAKKNNAGCPFFLSRQEFARAPVAFPSSLTGAEREVERPILLLAWHGANNYDRQDRDRR